MGDHARIERANMQAGVGTDVAILSEPPGVPTLRSMTVKFFLGVVGIGAWLQIYFGSVICVKGVAGILVMYAIMSFNEYVAHRYYQHLGINKEPLYRWFRKTFNLDAAKSSGHVEHHKETLDDMTLDQRPHPVLDGDPFRGTAFSWYVSFLMTTEIAIQSYPVLWLMGWSFKASTAALFVGLVFHAAVWQTLHPAMHELPDPPLAYGIPGWSLKWIRNSGYFRWLYMNHEGHHRVMGAHGNYNVCFPLMDHLFGTYSGYIPPKESGKAVCPEIVVSS